ncbi:MAG: SDR family oxidoreductase, partial [Candidatus Atribacteria bacterium]|nr:SDR family oxidoreductase [Candidatus Atribacteria bacterium]
GIIRSDMSKKKIATATEKYLNQIPLQRFGEPEDIVGMVLLLVSRAGNYVTGQIININGGMG